jgi:hypothetical protein
MKCLTHKPHAKYATSSTRFDVPTFRRFPRPRNHCRRGVSSVLAMMFLVIFSSLAAAMAVVAQSNMRTADSALKLSRAMSAAETGMVFAQRRLEAEARRFVVEKGVIDPAYAEDLWLGTYDTGSDGDVEVLDPVGYTVSTPPSGVVYALLDAHMADEHTIIVNGGDTSLPDVDDEFGTLHCRPIALSDEENAPYFRLTYELLQDDPDVDDEPQVRVTSMGVAGDITRTITMDFMLEKKIEFAILSPNRIMIGKNVLVEGPLGSRYGLVAGELDSDNGDPLVLRSDFYYLADDLNTKLDLFNQQVQAFDVDGDNRLRPNHPEESDGLSGQPDLADYDGDEYVDDFDLFLAHFDANGDVKICYDSSLANASGHGNMSEEFTGVDDQLMWLLDKADADRDDDGEITSADTGLGYNDGVIDVNDFYAKVRGRLGFAVARSPWDAANGASYQTIVQGAVRVDIEEPPITFEVTDEEMREITTEMFDESQTWFDDQSSAGQPFADQVTAGLSADGEYEAPSASTWEPVPFGSVGAYDHYQRPIYRNMTFHNVRIPKATNALFEDCTFVGVTYVEINEECTDFNWNYAGAVEKRVNPTTGQVTYPLRFPGLQATIPSTGQVIPNTKTESNNIRFHHCTFLGSIAGSKPGEYAHWRNKLQMTGTTRFYIDPDDDDLAAQDDAGELQSELNSLSEAEREEMEKSSILLPGWSVDVGNFNNEQGGTPEETATVKLKGTIIAGILDVRGTADVHGTLLMTFRPTAGQGPLYYGGLPDAFNTTIGYFGPLDGDGEGQVPGDDSFQGFGQITLRYDPDAKLPDGIPWPIRATAHPVTYSE